MTMPFAIIQMLRLPMVWAVVAMLALMGTGWCDLDTIYMANGDVFHGKVQQVTGEFIEYRTETGSLATVQRIQLASRMDRLITNKGKQYDGEIINMGGFIIEIHTQAGHEGRLAAVQKIADTGPASKRFLRRPTTRILELRVVALTPPGFFGGGHIGQNRPQPCGNPKSWYRSGWRP